jgi:hypothetical protein
VAHGRLLLPLAHAGGRTRRVLLLLLLLLLLGARAPLDARVVERRLCRVAGDL